MPCKWVIFRASSVLQSQIFRCSRVPVDLHLLRWGSVLNQERTKKKSVLLRLLCPFLGAFLSVLYMLSLMPPSFTVDTE